MTEKELQEAVAEAMRRARVKAAVDQDAFLVLAVAAIRVVREAEHRANHCQYDPARPHGAPCTCGAEGLTPEETEAVLDATRWVEWIGSETSRSRYGVLTSARSKLARLAKEKE